MAFNPPLGSTNADVFMGNVQRLDELINGPAADVPDRAGDPLYSWRLTRHLRFSDRRPANGIFHSAGP